MRQIEDYFVDSMAQDLYHYTGVDSLLGIAKSKALWASNVYFLNDSSEITHACDVLNDVLEPRVIFGNRQLPEYEFQKQFRDWAESCRTTTYNVFVFSLSEQPSQLSQWRSYTPHGKGVSIGLSGETIVSIAKMSCLRVARCLYRREEHEELIRGLLRAVKVPDMTYDLVRRAKARSFSGCEPHLATFALIGGNRSRRGGNETTEAFGVKGPLRDLSSMQAVM